MRHVNDYILRLVLGLFAKIAGDGKESFIFSGSVWITLAGIQIDPMHGLHMPR